MQPVSRAVLQPQPNRSSEVSQALSLCLLQASVSESEIQLLQDVEISMLEVGYELGDDRILLWLPWIAKHVITEESPLKNWLNPSGFMADADACIAVVVRLGRSSGLISSTYIEMSDARDRTCTVDLVHRGKPIDILILYCVFSSTGSRQRAAFLWNSYLIKKRFWGSWPSKARHATMPWDLLQYNSLLCMTGRSLHVYQCTESNAHAAL